MRLEYKFEVSDVEIPRFSVEAVEGIGKLFTLGTLVLNILETKRAVEIVFHGLNGDDPARKLGAFEKIVRSCETAAEIEFDRGRSGSIQGSSSYYQWVTLRRAGAGRGD